MVKLFDKVSVIDSEDMINGHAGSGRPWLAISNRSDTSQNHIFQPADRL